MSFSEKIRVIEEEMGKTQINKATEHHLGRLKAKLAKLKSEAVDRAKAKGGGVNFDVRKSGDASIALVGFPSVGKSSLLNRLTDAKAATEAYAFTTLTCIPGILIYKGAKIQILDLPGILEGAYSGLGRGKEVLAVARTANMVLLVVDVFNPRLDVIINELWNIGIRINEKPPNINIKHKFRGGITINTTIKLTKLDEKTILAIMSEYGIHNANIVIRDDITVDQLIDVLIGNRVYLPAIALLNKADLVSKEYIKELQNKLNIQILAVSAKTGYKLEEVKKTIYRKLNFIRIYTRSRSIKKENDNDEPMMMQKGETIKRLCQKLHREMIDNFRYAQVWGDSAKHPGQKVGLEHVLKDKDIVTIVTHTGYSKQD